MSTDAEKKQFLKEYEDVLEMSELRALSKISLKRPLTNKEYKRMMELGKNQGFPVGG